MTFIADLTPCSYLDGSGELGLLAVGWLSGRAQYNTGKVAPAVRTRLCELLEIPLPHFMFAGRHPCDLCPGIGALRTPGSPFGSLNLVVPGPRRLYACPELITHYVEAHEYAPPDEFCEAVLACPSPASVDYYESLFAVGGRPWELMFARPPEHYELDTYKVGYRALQRWRARRAT